ncbi:hypothetical protein R1sor_014720 [Riccia sorocarpa]|uniref:RING-type domain-containing protein n=1 Tax=Riccia sorocarpa TaxID=122646 RepID=A0ABD3HC22_9MARC
MMTKNIAVSGCSTSKVLGCNHKSAKTGSLCCVAARPHGSSVGTDNWSNGPREPHWRTNSGFSPPLSSRWENKSQPEELAAAANALQMHRRSFSSSSRGSRSNSRAGSARFLGHHRNISGSIFSHSGSPSESFRAPHWNPLSSSSGHMDNYIAATTDSISSPSVTIISSKEGLQSGNFSTVSNTPESTPSSFVGDYPQVTVGYHPSSSQRQQAGGHSFMSKSAFPLGSHPHLTRQTSDSRLHGVGSSRSVEGRQDGRHSFRWSGSSGGESSVGSLGGASDWWSMQTFSELVASSRRERLRWTSASSPSDFGWGTCRESLDRGLLAMDRIRAGSAQASTASPRAEAQACGVCSRLLAQRSPWSSYRMVGSADCTVVGVLVCGHVYHAECLEQATPEAKRQDPPCPRCGAAEKAARKAANSVEPVHVVKGCTSKPSNVQCQSSSRNKLSRIGVATDDISGPEFSSRHSFTEGGKAAPGTSISEKLSLGKSLSRRQFSFRNRSAKESSSADAIPKKPGSPAQVSPDSSSEDQPISALPQPKKLRSSSFRYLKRW